jgi:hypothetical protein
MTLRKFLSVSFFCLISITLLFPAALMARESNRRTLQAVRTALPPQINGTLNDPLWDMAEPATDFFQYEPHNDRPASQHSSVRVLYDDQAIYIGAMLYDPEPESILTELGLRDANDQLNADQFWVDINPFNDGINGFRFKVSASGVQTDINMSGSGGSRGDINWDAVWISAVNITDNGWIVEMEIPYSALRFPRGDVQEWGINFWREVRRTRESSSWNFVNRRVGDPIASMGRLTGIHDVTPPLRLSFFPYVSGYAEKNGGGMGWANTFNGGMDVKYGITEGFTMDMTLIPDFGQVQSDERILNLSPFEVKYDENRQFFTEGTELFSKADLFYSRRIGARPSGYLKAFDALEEDERVLENPLENRMINATKFSGRTAGGLGIGLFNAMTAASRATLIGTLTGHQRQVTTQPFTNYNLVVLDQSLPNNSFVSLANTNVAGAAEGYTANVTGTEFRVLDRSNMFRATGTAAISQQYYRDTEDVFGYKYDLALGKFGGTWQYNYSRSVITDTYDQNDMGFLRRNNQVVDGAAFSYNIFDPFWRLWNFSTGISAEYSQLYEPNTFTGLNLGYNLRALFDTRFFIRLAANYQPRGHRDYFEPRVAGRFYETDDAFDANLMYSSDYRKRMYVDGNFAYARINSGYGQETFMVDFRPTFRASDRWNMSLGVRYEEKHNDIGYVRHLSPDSVFFGKRFSPTLTNTVRSTYIFSNVLSLDFNLRHYWSQVEYDGSYFLLGQDGRLQPFAEDLQVNNINYNAFTIDLLVTWNFAPGSQLTAAWKNVIDSRSSALEHAYLDNLSRILGEPQINSFSIKLLYYIDYQMIQRLSRRH